MSWLFLSHAHITSERDIALQEWPECIPFDESTLPAGNIPVGLYGPSWWWTVPGTTISGEWIQKLLPWFPNPSHSFFFFSTFYSITMIHQKKKKRKKHLSDSPTNYPGSFLPSPLSWMSFSCSLTNAPSSGFKTPEAPYLLQELTMLQAKLSQFVSLGVTWRNRSNKLNLAFDWEP